MEDMAFEVGKEAEKGVPEEPEKRPYFANSRRSTTLEFTHATTKKIRDEVIWQEFQFTHSMTHYDVVFPF